MNKRLNRFNLMRGIRVRFFNFFYLASLCGLFLAGCAAPTLPPSSVPNAVSSSILNHPWAARGKISFETVQSHDAAFFYWVKYPERYKINLWGPLGMGRILIEGDSSRVSLKTSKGKVYKAATPEILLKQHTGLTLPFKPLMYWLRGLPVPSDLDKEIKPWRVHYLSYQKYDIPRLMTLDNLDDCAENQGSKDNNKKRHKESCIKIKIFMDAFGSV